MDYYSFKQLLRPPNSNLRHTVKQSYQDLFAGLRAVLKGEIRMDAKNAKIEYFPLEPYDAAVPKQYKHELAIAAIVKNEGLYLQEWIEFHHMIGCSKFFIYDNSSSDDTRSILEFYAKKGLVDWIEWPHMAPWLNSQHTAYCHAIYKCRGQVKWLALIDADEFLFSPLQRNLLLFLQQYEDLPAMVVYWDIFGASGHQTRPDGLVIENYTRRMDLTHPNNTYKPLTKSIVQPHRIKAVTDAHFFRTSVWPAIGYDENRRLITKGSDIHPQRGIRLNHYYTKSMDEWIKRLNLNNSRRPSQRSGQNIFRKIHQYEVEDPSIQYLVPELKQRINTIG